MRRDRRRLLPALLVSLLGAGLGAAAPVAAQQVRFVPRPDRPVERQLHGFLAAGKYRVWTRDTVLARGDEVDGPVLVLGATVRSAARIHGSIYVVAGDLFLRPGSRVDGDAVVLGGGWYASSLARVEGRVVYRPNLLLRVLRTGEGWEIVPVENVPRPLSLEGFYGLGVPRYDRVEAWTFAWGATARATELSWQPSLSGRLYVHTKGRGALGAWVQQSWFPTGLLRLDLTAERRTLSNEDWIRGDFSNSLAYLFGSGDYRDYYRADRVSVGLENTTLAGWQTRLSVGWEQDRTLPALRLPVFFKADSVVQPNPFIDEGHMWSARASIGYAHRAASWRLDARVGVEAADSALGGDFSFLLGRAEVSGRTAAVPGIGLEFQGVARADLAGTLPGQRWSSIGGSGTLPTLPVLDLRGPRLLFGQLTAVIPVSAVSVPVLGNPAVFLRDAIGTAWGPGERPRFRDNVIAGLRVFVVEAGLAVDPAVSNLDPTWMLSVSLQGARGR